MRLPNTWGRRPDNPALPRACLSANRLHSGHSRWPGLNSLENPYTRLMPIKGEPDSCLIEVTAGRLIFMFFVTRLFLSRRRLEGHLSVDWRHASGSQLEGGLPMGKLPPTNVDWRSNSSLDTQRKRLQD